MTKRTYIARAVAITLNMASVPVAASSAGNVALVLVALAMAGAGVLATWTLGYAEGRAEEA